MVAAADTIPTSPDHAVFIAVALIVIRDPVPLLIDVSVAALLGSPVKVTMKAAAETLRLKLVPFHFAAKLRSQHYD